MDAANRLSTLAEVVSARSTQSIDRALAAVRETLGMDIVCISEFVGKEQVYRWVEGDAQSFGFWKGKSVPLEAAFYKLVVEGRLPNVIPNAKGDEHVKELGIAHDIDIGSYVGAPLEFSDGRLYGTLCAFSHSPSPSLKERDGDFIKVIACQVSDQLQHEELESKNLQLQMKVVSVTALLIALEVRDGYTSEHTESVVDLSVAMAQRMGLSDEEVADVEQVALLHDIGKIGVPDSILRKGECLDEDEWELMREHPVIGERIVRRIECLTHLAPMIRAEHERWDGKGYPDGLSGEEIPLISRIVFVCDAFHAMISDRPYRKALGIWEAVEELKRVSGAQFCPSTVLGLIEVLKTRNQLPHEM